MTKDETRQLKGVAILMMLWLHLFSDQASVNLCGYWLTYVNGLPLVYALTRIASCCVPFYVLLGGYGLAKTYELRNGDVQGGRRAWTLMANFWIVFLIFVPLGCVFNSRLFPDSMLTLLLNAVGISYSYNGAWWFLLPYVVLTLLARPLIKRIFGQNGRQDTMMVAVLSVVTIGVYLIADDMKLDLTSPLMALVTLLNVAGLMLLFCAGILLVKYRSVERARERLKKWPQMGLLAVLAVLCGVKMLLGGSSLLNVPFTLLVVPLLLAVRWPQSLRRVMYFMGRHSTNMWLTHYFYYFIFGRLIYGLHYPLLIFAFLTGASVACAMLLNPLTEWVRRRIRGV